MLKRQGTRVLLVSRYCLDAQPYNTTQTTVSWDKCTLRTWLNDDFLNAAFTQREIGAIETTTVDNGIKQGYTFWKTSGCSNTQDRIFLLSYAEAAEYFGLTHTYCAGMNSKAAVTDYAAARAGYLDSAPKDADGKTIGIWWLRSPGANTEHGAMALSSGYVGSNKVSYTQAVVRPAMWLDLSLLIDRPETTTASAGISVGEYVTFGTYEQDNDRTNGA